MTNTDKFLDLNECVQFILFTNAENTNLSGDIIESVSYMQLYDRLRNHFKEFKEEYKEPLLGLIKGLTKDQINRCYYKNNLYEFIECEKPKKVLKNILKVMNTKTGIKNPRVSYKIDPKAKGDAWEFISCEDIPSNIKDDLFTLKEMMLEFVYSDIIMYDRIQRNKHDIRKTITAQDTDSVMPCIYQWCMYCRSIEKENGYCNGIDVNLTNISGANIMADILKGVIDRSMYTYTTNSNLLERFKGRINMKNEFLFSRQVLADVKKRYLSMQILREGTVLDPPKLDIKG